MLTSVAVVLNTKSFNWFYLFSFFLLDKYYICSCTRLEKSSMIFFFKEDVVVVIVWWLDLQLLMQSVAIPTNIVSSNPARGEMYSIQHYVIMFVSDLWQGSDFFWELWFPPPINLTARYNWNIVESGIKHHNPNLFILLDQYNICSCARHEQSSMIF